MIFDTHAHYDDEAFDEDRESLLESLEKNQITKIVNVGADISSSRATISLTKQYPFIYGAIGVHPSETKELTQKDMDWVREASKSSKIVAIGEIGLDYYWGEPEKEVQKKWFREQIKIAKEEKLPVIIHSRDAAKDTLEIMKEECAEEVGGVIHCFSYSAEMAKEYIQMGFYIGIGGVVTFKNAKKLKEVVEQIPLESIVLETDCPYLAPEGRRGERNCSLYLPRVIQEISSLKQIEESTVIEQTYQNAIQLYHL